MIGVPIVYRVVNGEPAGPAMMNGQRFGEELAAYVLGEDKYEAWLEEKDGDSYVDGATRWKWNREDFDRHDALAQEEKKREAERDKVRAEQAAQRKAAKAAKVA